MLQTARSMQIITGNPLLPFEAATLGPVACNLKTEACNFPKHFLLKTHIGAIFNACRAFSPRLLNITYRSLIDLRFTDQLAQTSFIY